MPRPHQNRKWCPTCGKVCYQGKEDAHARIARMPINAGYMFLNTYRCASGFWHVGHNWRMLEPFERLKKV